MPPPDRSRNVYFVGAGLASAAGLPNTPSLLDAVLVLAKQNRSSVTEDDLTRAFKFFYPDAVHVGFRPNVVDFFTTLRTFLDVGAGFVETGFANAADLYRALKLSIARALVDGLRDLTDARLRDHGYLDQMVQPGNIIITSNWDVLVERTAQLKAVPVRLCGGATDNALLLLKLHGSIDWSTASNTKRKLTKANYAWLKEVLFVDPPYKFSFGSKLRDREPDLLVRTRCLEGWTSAWNLLRSRTLDPHMVTMVRGKSGDLGPLRDVWRDAYGALSRARTLEIVGYSMPDDDAEIRTLLRAGIHRGSQAARVMVRNPSPDVHDRVRAFLERAARSSYLPIEPV